MISSAVTKLSNSIEKVFELSRRTFKVSSGKYFFSILNTTPESFKECTKQFLAPALILNLKVVSLATKSSFGKTKNSSSLFISNSLIAASAISRFALEVRKVKTAEKREIISPAQATNELTVISIVFLRRLVSKLSVQTKFYSSLRSPLLPVF